MVISTNDLLIVVVVAAIAIYCFGITLQTNDSGLASYVAGQVDRSLNWKVMSIFHIYAFPNT